ncbi:MAG: ATP-binding protein [Planctomycetota bacterium]|jgi:CheY-like chemotaxis protein/anti-sigma regulatory factor (Ser/Thr protein kinase)
MPTSPQTSTASADSPLNADAQTIDDNPNTPNVLVVDDSPVDRAIVLRFLGSYGFQKLNTAVDGAEALAYIEEHQPDLVVTDIQMPVKNGLELVQEVKTRFPAVPVILMTSQGSDELAIEALEKGAASYVPKRQLADRLADTVQQVLAASRDYHRQRHLLNFWVSNQTDFCLTSDVGLIQPLVSWLQQSAQRVLDTDDTDTLRIGIALSEALRNAIDHGNLEMDSELRLDDCGRYYEIAAERATRDPWQTRRVYVTVTESPGEVIYRIRDEGNGFDVSQFEYDPTATENLSRPCGRGMFLIRKFMHSVSHNSTGNEVTLTYRIGQADDD